MPSPAARGARRLWATSRVNWARSCISASIASWDLARSEVASARSPTRPLSRAEMRLTMSAVMNSVAVRTTRIRMTYSGRSALLRGMPWKAM